VICRPALSLFSSARDRALWVGEGRKAGDTPNEGRKAGIKKRSGRIKRGKSGLFYWESKKVDTPTARSGGILASLRTACRSRSYTRSTSVLTLGMPYREQNFHSFVPDVFRRIMISIMPDPTTWAFPDSI
jgi:hypothetical protein